MDVTAMLCNYAEVQNNLLYVSGAGIDRAFVPQGAPGPYVSTLALAVQVQVPWTATEQDHDLVIDLVDDDGRPVQVPQGPDQTGTVQASLRFQVGRPPGLAVGEDQIMSFAVTLPGLPLPAVARYAFLISVDGTELRRVHYKLVEQPGQPGQPGQPPRPGSGTGSGPADIPNF